MTTPPQFQHPDLFSLPTSCRLVFVQEQVGLEYTEKSDRTSKKQIWSFKRPLGVQARVSPGTD
jgi:hypothetical protein